MTLKITTIRTLLATIDEIVNEVDDKPYEESRDAILAEASEKDKANLEIFSWLLETIVPR